MCDDLESELKEDGVQSVPAVPSRTKIPLVQRGGSIVPQTADDGVKGKKGKGAATAAQGSESPTTDDNLEEKTVIDSYNFALG